MTTCWERAALYVNCMFDLCLFVILVVSHFCFEGMTLVLIAPVPGQCLPFTFWRDKSQKTWASRGVRKSVLGVSHQDGFPTRSVTNWVVQP